MTITTTYEGPDLDGYSCAVAYAELLRAQGKEAKAAIFGEPQLEVQWILSKFGISPIGPISPIGSITAVLDADNTTTNFTQQDGGTDVFAAGDNLGATITTTAGWLPVTADVDVVVGVIYSGRFT